MMMMIIIIIIIEKKASMFHKWFGTTVNMDCSSMNGVSVKESVENDIQ